MALSLLAFLLSSPPWSVEIFSVSFTGFPSGPALSAGGTCFLFHLPIKTIVMPVGTKEAPAFSFLSLFLLSLVLWAHPV